MKWDSRLSGRFAGDPDCVARQRAACDLLGGAVVASGVGTMCRLKAEDPDGCGRAKGRKGFN